MKTLLIKPELTHADLVEYSAQWDSEKNIAIEISSKLKGAELRRLVDLMITELPNIFFYAVLETLAERQNLPANLQRVIFLRGDTGCKTSICLRDDLDDDLKQKCSECEDDDVREHFQQKQLQSQLCGSNGA